MALIRLSDRRRILDYCRSDIFLHLYSIGDLDDFFRLHTQWFALEAPGGKIQALVLLYTGMSPATLLALTAEPGPMRELLRQVVPHLPERCLAHLSPGLEQVLKDAFRPDAHGRHLKMGLPDTRRLREIPAGDTEPLYPADRDELQRFYHRSYPGSWFDPRMLETGQYYGVRRNGTIVSAGGIHVYSPRYRVAALGNIATAPENRGRGLGKQVTARICNSLLEQVDHIGLNVKADNAAALRLYRQFGFEYCARYNEFMLTKRRDS